MAKVVDGDTISVYQDGGLETVRLIGVDTPETKHLSKPVECFGYEASNFAKTHLQGKRVILEPDTSQGNVDKYGRLLRYVVFEDGKIFNEMIIRQGYGYEYTYDSAYKYQSYFKQAQHYAQSQGNGLWAEGACTKDNENHATGASVQNNEAPSGNATSCQCGGNLYNCGDFGTHNEAQSIYECCLAEVGSDIHRLDGDDDRAACESLP